MATLFVLLMLLSVTVNAADQQELRQQAQQLIDGAPLTLERFLADPGGALYRASLGALRTAWDERIRQFTQLVLYLLFGGVVALALPGMKLRSMLEWIYTAGLFLLLNTAAIHPVSEFCARVTEWKTYLIGFSPVFATVLTVSGHPALASMYTGFFLSAVQLFSHGIETLLLPVVRCYLAICTAGILSGSTELTSLCRAAGTLVQKAVRVAGTAFVSIIGLQRVVGAGADSAAIQASQTLVSAVPIIGQTISGASGTVLSALSLLRTGVGFAAIAVIGAEFLPLLLQLLLQLLFLHLGMLLCRLFELKTGAELFSCVILALEAVNALAILFFLIIAVTTALMIAL